MAPFSAANSTKTKTPNWVSVARLPPIGRCVLCLMPSKRARDICRHCEADLPWLADQAILPSADDRAAYSRHSLQLSRRAVTAVVAPLAYEREIVWLINQQKRPSGRVASRVLAQLLAQRIKATYANHDLPDFVIPVPLHWRRELRRGVNQAQMLVHWLSRSLPIRPRFDLLRRNRPTAKQSLLGHAERQSNVAGAFSLTAHGRKRIEAKTIAVVDDVLTTGATLNSIARCLTDAGVANVHLWAPARAVLGPPSQATSPAAQARKK